MILTRKECEDILDDTHVEYNLISNDVIDSFKNRERIKLVFNSVEEVKTYEGIYEKGEAVTKTKFEFKQI